MNRKKHLLFSKEQDRITVVVWLEGDDPECVDNLLGGEIKIHMEITEEHKTDQKYQEEETSVNADVND